jgi:rare lipoprotein A
MTTPRIVALVIGLFAALTLGTSSIAAPSSPNSSHSPKHGAAAGRHYQGATKRVHKIRVGKASYYGRNFYGKKMANGKPMNPESNVAASDTLPIGSTAKVTNQDTGQSAVVSIQDRGPYIKGRIVDVSPAVADKLGMKEDGVVPVKVETLSVPDKDTGSKPVTESEKR